MRITIAGAGIAGLTAALVLSRRGHRVEVLERSPTIDPVGAGIVLAPNALRILSALGVRLEACGEPVKRITIRNTAGAALETTEIGRILPGAGPTLAFHRAELHRALLDALGQSDGRLRGVGIAEPQVSDTMLETLSAAGVRGLRFVETRLPNGERYRGSTGFKDLPAMAPRMRDHGLHAETWANIEDFMEAFPMLDRAGLPIVLDHMGGFDVAKGLRNREFQRLLGLLKEGRVWLKLTLTRRSPNQPGYEELRRFHDALIEANPQQLVWGSDWPFVRMEIGRAHV